ncbi:MAG: DUF1194 domain-containing protein, partial [Pseudomonadota bacterium]
LALFVATFAQTASAQNRASINLVLALDASASVNGNEFALQRAGIAFALRDPDVRAAIIASPGGVNIAITQWSSISQQAVAVDWTSLTDDMSIRKLAKTVVEMPRHLSGGNTMIHAGLEFAGKLHESAPVPASRRVIDVSGNGHTDDLSLLVETRRDLIGDGIVINGLAIEEDPGNVTLHFAQYLIGGPGSFVMTATSWLDFARAMRLKLLRELEQKLVTR